MAQCSHFLSAPTAIAIAGLGCVLFQPDASAAPPEQTRPQPTPRLSIRWISDLTDKNQTAVEVSGLSSATLRQLRQLNWNPSQWQRLLAVYAGQSAGRTNVDLPPMLGAYRLQSRALRFVPQFPLEPGVTYRAVLQPAQLPGAGDSEAGPITAVLQAPSRRSDPVTVVRQVYPSADLLPENLLKFYVHFSAPMSRGHIYEYIHLQNERGQAIELPFLEIDEELWDPTMTRLTLFIDPGRIKRGVRPLEEVGPALETGKRYTLVIDRAWKDGAGNPLKENFQKTFNVGPPDRDPPDPTTWKIEPPKSGTRQPLTVTFPESLDQALAQRMIRATSESGNPVEGTIRLGDRERRWTFIPLHPWRRGRYQLVIQTTLEDLAGNNIGKPFDVDLFETVQPRLANSRVKLPFEVR